MKLLVVFDTTASNTGIKEGGMTHIEEDLGRGQMWLACRHHSQELHLKHPYDAIMHKSTGPDDPLSKDFKSWFTRERGK